MSKHTGVSVTNNEVLPPAFLVDQVDKFQRQIWMDQFVVTIPGQSGSGYFPNRKSLNSETGTSTNGNAILPFVLPSCCTEYLLWYDEFLGLDPGVMNSDVDIKNASHGWLSDLQSFGQAFSKFVRPLTVSGLESGLLNFDYPPGFVLN